MESAADPSFRTRLVVCLQRDSLIIVGTRLIGAYQGGWVQETRQCVTAIAFNNPELVFQALGVPDVGAETSDADETRGVLPDLYECLDTGEKVRFAVEMMVYSLTAAPFSGQQFLDSLPESEVECLETNLPAPVFEMIAEAPSVGGGELRDAPPELLACVSSESIGRIPGEAAGARHRRDQRGLAWVRGRPHLGSRGLHGVGGRLRRTCRGPVAGGIPGHSGGWPEVVRLPDGRGVGGVPGEVSAHDAAIRGFCVTPDLPGSRGFKGLLPNRDSPSPPHQVRGRLQPSPAGDLCTTGSANGDPYFHVTPASRAGQALSEVEGSGQVAVGVVA